MRPPGFVNAELPADRNDDSVRWLAEQIVADDRFASGTVKFWWPAIFGEDAMERPLDSSAEDYDLQIVIYNAQTQEIERLAAPFRNGTAGIGRGEYNLKDLLLEMVLSPWFTARRIDQPSATQEIALASIGSGRLSTPEQLHRKIIATTGLSWSKPWDDDEAELLLEYRTLYGGIDSDGITDRIEDINTLMNQVVDRMTTEMTCEMVAKDFQLPADQRLLFPFTDINDIPLGEGANNILQNIQYLHDRLLGESLSVTNEEIEATYLLFNEIRNLRIAEDRSTALYNENEICQLDWDDPERIELDPQHTLRAWMAVLNYLLSDYRFLYQ